MYTGHVKNLAVMIKVEYGGQREYKTKGYKF